MDAKEIISEIKTYCEKGLLNGLHFDVQYGSMTNILRAQNIHVEDNDVFFDQYSVRLGQFNYRNDYLRDHDIDYLQSLIAKIRENIKIDKNMF